MSSISEPFRKVGGVPLYTTEGAAVTGLPEPRKNTFYIVSAVVAQAMAHDREDLLMVYRPVRNSYGEVIGCRGLIQI